MQKPTDNILVVIAFLGFLTGTLDIIAAYAINYPTSFPQIFRYISSGFFGDKVSLGSHLVLWGMFFHYLIATLFSASFFMLHLKFKGLTKNTYLLGAIYGIFIWIIMNLAILPLTNIAKQPEHDHILWLPILRDMAVLIICLGLPISLISEKYYKKQARRRSRRHRAGKDIQLNN